MAAARHVIDQRFLIADQYQKVVSIRKMGADQPDIFLDFVLGTHWSLWPSHPATTNKTSTTVNRRILCLDS
jgi:hypothetical protein